MCSSDLEDTLIRSWFKLGQTIAFLANEALAPEDLEVRYVRLLARENLIRSLVQVLAEVQPVGSMTSGGDGLGLKVIWIRKLRNHGPFRIHKSPVLPLRYTILLWSVASGILMRNLLFTKKSFHGVVLELGTIITSNRHDTCIMLALNQSDELNDSLLSLTLLL